MLPEDFEKKLKSLEERFHNSGYDVKKIVHSEIRSTMPIQPQSENVFGMYLAICIGTIDPWKEN